MILVNLKEDYIELIEALLEMIKCQLPYRKYCMWIVDFMYLKYLTANKNLVILSLTPFSAKYLNKKSNLLSGNIYSQKAYMSYLFNESNIKKSRKITENVFPKKKNGKCIYLFTCYIYIQPT